MKQIDRKVLGTAFTQGFNSTASFQKSLLFFFFSCSIRVVVVVTALPTFVLRSSAPICLAAEPFRRPRARPGRGPTARAAEVSARFVPGSASSVQGLYQL